MELCFLMVLPNLGEVADLLQYSVVVLNLSLSLS